MVTQTAHLPEQDLKRGWRICERLGFPTRLLAACREIPRVLEDGTVDMNCSVSINGLSRSDKKLLHIARALIYNPEVLVVHSPTTYFDKRQAAIVMDVLRDFVASRGLEMPAETAWKRRPRTCIFSTGDLVDLKEVDQIFAVKDGTLTVVDMAHADEYVKSIHSLVGRRSRRAAAG